MSELLERLLEPSAPRTADRVEEWLAGSRTAAPGACAFDRAVIAATAAERPAWAFASAHQGALRHMLPDLPENAIVAFCVSEEQGAHPRHIQTSLQPMPGDGRDGGSRRYRLDGDKRWATLSPVADLLLVIASAGRDGDRNQLRLARVPSDRNGISIEPMPAKGPVPELPHATIALRNVPVDADEIDPGDAYVARVKPFRMLEDLLGAAAVLAAQIGLGLRHRWPTPELERGCALVLALRDVFHRDSGSAATQVAAAGCERLALETHDRWSPLRQALPEPLREVWRVGLLTVAAAARERRRELAWRRLGGRS